ncbi:MAG TPA: hypothetical protein VK517_02365 [Cyclobacteriaceae bacterium]|nr:hypothetical protein [Cyclobacteriaceae bacterium]
MDKTALVENAINEGKIIVENLDREGLFFPIAMWSFMPNNNEWRLILGKEDVNDVGARGYYKKIQKVLNKITPKPDITVSDISLISTHNEMAKLVKVALRPGRGISGRRFTGNVINRHLLPDAYIYRVE